MSVLVVRGSYIDAAGDEQQVLLSTHPWRDDELGDALPRISAGSDPEYRSVVAFPSMGGRGSLSYGSIEIINLDGEFDDWIAGDFHGRRWDIRRGEEYESWDELDPQFIARVRQVDFLGSAKVRVTFKNAMELLGNPIQINEYPPDLPNPDLRESLKPTMVGVCEHVPTDLIDAISSSEERFYVADTFNGTYFTSGVNGGCKEGLATIPLGSGAGEYEEWERGFDVHKSATLPLTGLFVKGPRKRLIHWISAHFSQWKDNATFGEIPEEPWLVFNALADTRELTRYENTDSLRVFHNSGSTTNLALRYDVVNVLEPGKDYVFRIWTAPVAGWSNRVRFRLVAWGPGITTVILGNTDFSADDGTMHEFAFNNNAGPLARRLSIQFRQHPDDEGMDEPSEIRILRAQLLPVVESGNASGVGIMTRASEIVPYLLLERGKRMFDLPPDFEQGPLHPTQIHYEALNGVSDEFPGLLMGWWWKDETTHADLLDLILTKTHNAGWRFDRQDRLTAEVQREPESYKGSFVSDHPMVLSLSVSATGTIAAPAGISAGDLVLLMAVTRGFFEPQTVVFTPPEGFNMFTEIKPGPDVLPAVPAIGLMYKISDGNEPSSYVVSEAPSGISLGALRIEGADPSNPFGPASLLHGQDVSTTGFTIPGITITRPQSLVLSLAGHGGTTAMRTIPDTVVIDFTGEWPYGIGGVVGDVGEIDDKFFETTSNVFWAGAVISINGILESDPVIFSDRFDIARGTLQVDGYDAPELTTRAGTRRNFRPMGEGEVAELNVPDYLRARYRTEWVSTQGVSDAIANLLPDAYSHARSAKLRETAIAPFSSGAILPLRADVQFHSKLRRWVIHHRITHDGGSIDGGEPGMLNHPRFDLDEGKMYIAVDTRHLRSRIEIRGLY